MLYGSELIFLTALTNQHLRERLPNELLTGDTTNILTYLQFEWYLYPLYLPVDKRNMERWLGVDQNL